MINHQTLRRCYNRPPSGVAIHQSDAYLLPLGFNYSRSAPSIGLICNPPSCRLSIAVTHTHTHAVSAVIEFDIISCWRGRTAGQWG